MVEQAVKTKQLVTLYYGRAPKYTYYDGHSQGGRQGYKIVQDYPELYEGYMIAAPALSIPMFGATALYPQIVMKTDLGCTAANKPEAAAFAAKVDAANKRPEWKTAGADRSAPTAVADANRSTAR